MARGGGMQEVELLDGEEPAAQAVVEPARPRRGRLWVLLGVAAVAVSLVATQWVVDSREKAAIARLAAVPGVLPAFGEELTVARTITRADVSALWGGITGANGARSSLEVAEDGSQALVAVDPDTGETLWSTPLLGPNPERASSLENSYGGSCQSDVDPDEVATVVVCLVTDGFTRYSTDGDGAEERVPATSTRVMVLDPDDGQVLSERPVDADARTAVLGGLVVVGTRDAERVTLVASDLRTGDERWTYEEPRKDLPEGAVDEGAAYWGLFRAGDVLVYSTASSIRLVSAAGQRVREDLWTSGGGYGTDPLTGNLLIFDYSADGVETTTLLAADGDPADDVVLDGGMLTLAVDDGSVPGVALTSSDHLSAWDRRTGDPLWEAEVQSTGSALVVRGRVYLTTATGIAALDGRTGAVVWDQDVPQSSAGTLATDGRDLLVSSTFDGGDDDGTPGGLTGYDLVTGEKTRYLPYPEGVFDVQAFRGLVIGWSPTTDETYLLE